MTTDQDNLVETLGPLIPRRDELRPDQEEALSRRENEKTNRAPNHRLDEAVKGVLSLQGAVEADLVDLMTVASQLTALCRSLEGRENDDLVPADHEVPIPFTVSEVVGAKRRHLHACLTRLQGRIAILTEATMRLQAESRPETAQQEPHVYHGIKVNTGTVHVPDAQEDFGGERNAKIDDSNFDPKALQQDMERTVAEGRRAAATAALDQDGVSLPKRHDWPFSRRGKEK